MAQLKNPIKAINDAYKRVIPNPAAEAIILAMIGIPVAYAGKNVIKNQVRTLLEDPRASTLLGTNARQVPGYLDQMQKNWLTQHGIPITIGLTPALVSAAFNMKPSQPGFGMTKWPYQNKQSMNKVSSMWQTPGYQPQLDFSQSINTLDTRQMLASNPYIHDNNYVRNFGTSIINAAPSYGNTTTLGNIYDSAVNKFDKKLEFQGIGSKALQGALSGSLAGMFTDVIGTVMGVPDPLRTRLANSVGVGKALYDILT